MPIGRAEFEGQGVDWHQRILFVLNSDRDKAYSEEELLDRLEQRPSVEQIRETLGRLVAEGFVETRVHSGTSYYIHALRGRRI